MGERNLVPPAKIRRYLLNTRSERGGPKARFFIEICGFSLEDPDGFAAALARHPESGELRHLVLRQDGADAVFRCEIATPARGRICIVSVWRLLPDGTALRLITARPLRRRERRE